MEYIVKTENLVFEYKIQAADDAAAETKAALGGVDIAVTQGEFVAVLGHNGSGKSTLAKHINCLLSPTSGIMWVKGISVADEARLWDIRSSVGMVFQNPDNQIIATIVEEDVAFGPENLGVPPAEIRARVDEALLSVGMAEFAENPPHFLSGGQKQRVAIAGILAMRPDIIVLDEPTAMLDPIGRREVISVVQKLNREGITIIFITHFMDEAAQADRIIVMEEGKVAMTGTPAEVFAQIAPLKAIGLDVPQVAEIADGLRRAGVALPQGILTVDALVEAICQLR
ncbi:MAG: energy-coupling factor transporter ATPase [Clostridiales bacterium]|jgi:energy-coupling factor transport system ATP-binding protein|nr:energy-coupling factor transporter ATPase [Clostridiales bacterium]